MVLVEFLKTANNFETDKVLYAENLASVDTSFVNDVVASVDVSLVKYVLEYPKLDDPWLPFISKIQDPLSELLRFIIT